MWGGGSRLNGWVGGVEGGEWRVLRVCRGGGVEGGGVEARRMEQLLSGRCLVPPLCSVVSANE